jgi:hypothetical protein
MTGCSRDGERDELALAEIVARGASAQAGQSLTLGRRSREPPTAHSRPTEFGREAQDPASR